MLPRRTKFINKTSPSNYQYNTNNKNMRSDERHEQIAQRPALDAR